MLLEVAGFQGCYRGKHRNNWRCARAVRALCENAPLDYWIGEFGSPNSKGVSKGCAWGLFGGNIVKVACSVRVVQGFPLRTPTCLHFISHRVMATVVGPSPSGCQHVHVQYARLPPTHPLLDPPPHTVGVEVRN